MRRTYIYIYVFILFFVLISCFVFAEYPKEKPLSAIGCEFLSINNDFLFAVGIYNNTVIYADTNNDNLWDISFNLNEGNNIELKQPNQNFIPIGSKIYSTKPVWLKQRNTYNYNYNQYTGFVKTFEHQMTLPSVDNLRKEYISTQPKIYILSDKDSHVDINGEINTISSHVLFSKNVIVPAKIVSDTPIYAFSDSGPLNPLSTDFYSDYDVVTLVIPDDETTLYFDYDLDGNYDNISLVNKGTQSYVFSNYGVHIWSDKNIGMSSMLSKIKDYYGIYTLYPVYPSSQMSNEYFLLSPSNSEMTSLTFVQDLFDNSTTRIYNVGDFQKSTYTEMSTNKLIHISADRPFLTKSYFYKVTNYDATSFESTPYPSADIVFIQYSNQKNIISSSNTTMTARLFNTFATMNLSNISIVFTINNPFIFFDSKTKIYTKNIFNDSIINETANLPTLSENGDVTFNFDSLQTNSYIEIQYTLKTPDSFSTYKLNAASVSYDVPTWS